MLCNTIAKNNPRIEIIKVVDIVTDDLAGIFEGIFYIHVRERNT